jgi:pimeloyl-ACP methyl ester carboxylesterase
MNRTATALVVAALAVGGLAAAAAPAQGKSKQLGTAFPADFPVLLDASLGTPLIGFGSGEGPVAHTPVIFLHGNNDTPFPTACNPLFGHLHDFAEYFLARGYRPSELWGLGYQGDQCDLIADQTIRSSTSHTSAASVPDLRAFVRAVLDYTGAERVDIVAHSLGGTVAREWLRQDRAYGLVRALVSVAGPHHGIINCSPSPLNYWQLPAFGGFTPASAVCVELGAVETPFLSALNAGDETPGPTRYLTVRASDVDFVYMPFDDGAFPGVPSLDRNGDPADFSDGPALAGAENLALAGQGAYDVLGTAHLGIWNSPETWRAALDFLRPSRR